ncbi:heparan-alpha-glucosaminideN-acetyltransferase-like protein [Cricetulus griseus]|nr:heparan-alpha-glucosaminideN-acetyltransferase-like protein [Cricetulus griseus]
MLDPAGPVDGVGTATRASFVSSVSDSAAEFGYGSLASDDSEQCHRTGIGNRPWPTWAGGWRQNCHLGFGLLIGLTGII